MSNEPGRTGPTGPSDPSVLVLDERRGGTVLVVFGGIKAGFGGEPIFEFRRIAQGWDCTKVLVRDLQQAWYLKGIPGHGDDLESSLRALHRKVLALGPDRIVATGNSAGAFAALAYGHRTGCDVVAFSPQTFLSTPLRWWHRDRRWPRQMRSFSRQRRWHRRDSDLRRILRSPAPHAARRPRLDVHYPRGFRLDMVHAERLRGLPGIHLHRHDHGDHELIRTLRDEGTLDALLVAAIRGDGP